MYFKVSRGFQYSTTIVHSTTSKLVSEAHTDCRCNVDAFQDVLHYVNLTFTPQNLVNIPSV